MCIGGSSNSPAPAPALPPPPAAFVPPPAMQVAKAPEMQASSSATANRRNGANAVGKMAGGTMLTGAAGIDASQLSTGKTLLGT